MKKQSDNTQPATKTDIRTLRTDFKRTEKSLRSESLRIEEQYEHLDDQVKDIKDQLTDLQEVQKRTEGKIDKLTNTVVNFVGRVATLEEENVVGGHHMRELDKRLTKHESLPHAA